MKIEKIGVIGAGVMGSTIAAHLANVGYEAILLDIVPKEAKDADEKLQEDAAAFKKLRNKLAQAGLDTAKKAKPAAFYIPQKAGRISIGNLEDDLKRLCEVDWIIEVVVERLDIKQSVFEKIESVMRPGTIITSNTSGISAEAMCQGRTEPFRKHFAITHFFNPPRYLKLLELVPGPDTLPEVMETLTDVAERKLGKGVVLAKDTPNFIANRIGLFSMFSIIRTMEKLGLSVEAVDQLTGKAIGRAKSASFRTMDLVGVDTVIHASSNVYEHALDDEWRTDFKPPDLVEKMVQAGLLGEKSEQGFYRKSRDDKGKRVILSLDLLTMEHTPQAKVKFPSLTSAKTLPGTAQKVKAIYYARDPAGEFTFEHLSKTFIYSANRLGDIADRLYEIDNAMKWGFAWRLGPFEVWDAVGVRKSVEAMENAGYEIPGWVTDMLAGGNESFYRDEAGARCYYDPASKSYKEIPGRPEIILLPWHKAQNKVIETNKGASLIDIGDGVACLEFHSKMNAIGADTMSMISKAVDIVSKDFEGLVIANHSDNFSVGANLPLVLFAAQEEEWDDIDWMVRTFQQTLMKLKYSSKPVVAAPAGMALGGGCEICLNADRVRFAAETYMGLVEAGVGLLPAGGGSKEMLVRAVENLFDIAKGGIVSAPIDLTPFVSRAFETVAMAKVSTSGLEAEKLGYLRRTDKMTVNRDFLLHDAKQTVLALAKEGYEPPEPATDIRVGGEPLLALMKLAAWSLRDAGYVTDHDVIVALELARVLCGASVQANTRVTEQYILDLEREGFLRLCGMQKTQARIEHTLKTGKPLRN